MRGSPGLQPSPHGRLRRRRGTHLARRFQASHLATDRRPGGPDARPAARGHPAGHGLGGRHMHVFSTPRRDYGTPDSDLGHADEDKVTLAEVLAEPGARMRYTYDFGDDWEHDIVLEKVLPPDRVARVSCLAGKGACPPEDCGGAWGYACLKEVLADPDHEEHEDLLDLLGPDSPPDLHPAPVPLPAVNATLRPAAPP